MSNKRWSLPTQKGIELFPKVTIAPPKLVISGAAPGTPLFHSLAQRFGGQLKAAHGKFQRDYSLSIGKVMKRRVRLDDDARMTYTNIDGQETIQLEVAGHVVKQEEKKLGKPTPWDWALVEYHVPLAGADGMHVFMKAIRTIPRSTEIGITNDGFVYDFVPSHPPLYVDGLDPPVLRYPASDMIDAYTFVAGNVQISSLAIDLRRFFGAPVTVELWGYSIGTGVVPDLYHGPIMVMESFTNNALGVTDYSVTTDSWSPPLASIVSLWPYYGIATMPTVDGVTVDTSVVFATGGVSVHAEDAPAPPVSLLPSVYQPVETSTMLTLDWGHRITYDPVSGLPIKAIASVMASETEIISGPNNPRVSRWTFSYQDQVYTRPIEVDYKTTEVPTECHGEIKFAGGFGAPPWKNMQVNTDATEYGRLYAEEGKFIPVVKIADDVIVRGGTGVSYQLLGRFSVFPFQYTAGFTKT